MIDKHNQQNNGWMHRLKSFCIEQSWLILLLAPLIIIAVLVTKHVQPNNNHRLIKRQSQSIINASAEVTTAQLAMIVAKPLSELIQMEVYLNPLKTVSTSKLEMKKFKINFIKQAYNQQDVDDKKQMSSVNTHFDIEKDG